MNYYRIEIMDPFGFTTKVFVKTPCRLHGPVINKKFDLDDETTITEIRILSFFQYYFYSLRSPLTKPHLWHDFRQCKVTL